MNHGKSQKRAKQSSSVGICDCGTTVVQLQTTENEFKTGHVFFSALIF